MSKNIVEDIKKLRDISGAGMTDCKAALIECNGNIEDAVDYLRKKGMASASKKASRVATQGVVAINPPSPPVDFNVNKMSMLEVNCETDFVARSEKFQDFAAKVTAVSGNFSSVADLLQAQPANFNASITEEVAALIGTIGEKIELRRLAALEAGQNGVVSAYIHGAIAPGMGSVGVLVSLESSSPIDKAELYLLGKQIAMHIAANSPRSLDIASLDPADIEREKAIVQEQTAASGKPPAVIEKIVAGRMNTFYKESVLLEQEFVMDNKLKVSEVLLQFGKKHGATVNIKAFKRFMLGEGIEKQSANFADEVAAMVKG